MNYLLDTCTVSDFFKKMPASIAHFAALSPSQLYISTITVMEVEYGLKLHKEREVKIRPLWTALLQNISVVPFSHADAVFAAKIRAQLKEVGLPIGAYDIQLAGTALANNFIFVTSNSGEFKRIAEITIENWRE